MENIELNQLATECHRISKAHGFRPADWLSEDSVPTKLALIHSEVSEALEAYRQGDHRNFGEELADVVIRTLDLAAALHIDIRKEVNDKMEKNRHRSYKHGGKRV